MTADQLTYLCNVVAMLILLACLVSMRYTQRRLQIECWLIGLVLAFTAQIPWFFTTLHGLRALAMHTLRLDLELLAGIAFLFHNGEASQFGRGRSRYLLWNAVPLLCLETVFGFYLPHPAPYVLCALAGIAMAVRSRASFVVSRRMAVGATMVWVTIAAAALSGHYRAAAYFGSAAVFAAAALSLWRRTTGQSVGRYAMVAGLAVWSASFAIHPWVIAHKFFQPAADQVWSLQKFFVAIGLILLIKEQEALDLWQKAVRDSLTGLANRSFAEARLVALIGEGRASVLILDLNGFKNVNDTLGHLAGDALLCSVAGRLARMVDEDEVLARMGGDEFLLVSPRDLNRTAAQIRTVLRDPFWVEGREVSIGASIGVAHFPADAKDCSEGDAINDLMRAADHRMYLGKRRLDEALVLSQRRAAG